jgi:MoaA/NifB/PqqE/SkfB family radical SAM enzyme
MRLLRLLRHARALRSVPLRALGVRAATLLPDLAGDGATRALVNITLELTYRCNVQCEFCFLKDSVLYQKRDELTAAEIARLAQQARPYGASFFLTGGEPLLRRDLAEIVGAIKGCGLKVGLNTNGLLLDQHVGAELRAAGLDYVIVSLHGPRELHDCLENRSGSFDRVLANLQAFAAAKGATRVLVNCVVARGNHARLSELPGLLASVPIDGLTFQHESFLTGKEVRQHERVWQAFFPERPLPMVYQSSGYGQRDFAAMEREVEALVGAEARRRWPFPIFFKPLLKGQELRDWYTSDLQVKGRCLYIWTDTRVEPDGLVNACQVMPTPMGNLRAQPLAEILNAAIYREFRARNREAGGVFPACARCCKLYRNPMNFMAHSPAWQEWTEAVEPSPAR